MAFFVNILSNQICANSSLLRTFTSNCNFLVHACGKDQRLTYQYVKIQHLYEQGGRSFWIHNTGPIGCLPVNFFYILNPEPGYVDQYGCVKKQNEMAMEFNRQLKDRVIKLRTELPEASITLVDVYTAKIAMISNAKKLGNHHHHHGWPLNSMLCKGISIYQFVLIFYRNGGSIKALLRISHELRSRMVWEQSNHQQNRSIWRFVQKPVYVCKLGWSSLHSGCKSVCCISYTQWLIIRPCNSYFSSMS